MKKTNKKVQKSKTTFSHKMNVLSFWFKKMSFVKHILIFYLLITLLGSLILFMPLSQQAGVHVSYVDALFTAASSFSDTGLATTVTSTTWSFFGQGVVSILILLGGIGIFAMKIFIFNIIFGRPITFFSRQTLAAERGSTRIGSTRSIIKISLILMFAIIALASLTFSLYFYYVTPDIGSVSGHPELGNIVGTSPQGDWATSIRYGLFHSISALNNAGFDIMGSNSIAGYYNEYGIQIMFVMLFVIGGMGYPVLHDTYMWIKGKFTGQRHKFSLFSKISSITYLTIVIVSLTSTFAIELTASSSAAGAGSSSFWNSTSHGSSGDKIMAIFFNTMSTRNAGFATVDMHEFTGSTLTMFSLLMFIGSAPSSTAGGIRTTTIAIIFMSIWARIRGRKYVSAFSKRVPTATIQKAFVVFAAAFFVSFIGILITATSLTELGGAAAFTGNGTGVHYSHLDIIFEVTSAFGTTGLSTGITDKLNIPSKLTLILIMFIGQLGVSSSLLVWGDGKETGKHYRYPKQEIGIG